ncbi:uncharacterized protein LOC129617886, partial [Condylostylus longicornis]|uniref:uncharacterized protein LOC129617886 n=1 Tax=Condylostylus longicornis TaxID=2530218 RepID=UPI00244DB788
MGKIKKDKKRSHNGGAMDVDDVSASGMDDHMTNAEGEKETSHSISKRHATEWKAVKKEVSLLKKRKQKLKKKVVSEREEKKKISKEIKSLLETTRNRHLAEAKQQEVGLDPQENLGMVDDSLNLKDSPVFFVGAHPDTDALLLSRDMPRNTSRNPQDVNPTGRSNQDAPNIDNTTRGDVRGDLGDAGRNRVYGLHDHSDINETELKGLFETFLQTFRLSSENSEWDEEIFDVEPRQPFYMHQIQTLFENAMNSETACCDFSIDLQHINKSSLVLLKAIIRHPADLVIFMDEVLADIISRLYASYDISDHLLQNRRLSLKTSLFHHPHVRCMRDLDPKDIETLVAIRGIVVRCSSIMPDMRQAVFRCTSRKQDDPSGQICGYEEVRAITGGHIDEPLICIKCQSRYTFELFHSQCVFGNKQLIKVQETPESIPEGETPQTLLAYVYDEMVDICKPGDFIELTGIYRASGVRIVPRMRTLKSVYRVYIDVNSIHKDHLNRFLIAESQMVGPAADAHLDGQEDILMDDVRQQRQQERHQRAYGGQMSNELMERMKALGQDPNIYEKLVKSLAPNIWESDDVKKEFAYIDYNLFISNNCFPSGLLCQLFGGTVKAIGGRATRSDIHVLLCGDPSTAKSQLLKYAHGIAPR